MGKTWRILLYTKVLKKQESTDLFQNISIPDTGRKNMQNRKLQWIFRLMRFRLLISNRISVQCHHGEIR